MGKIWPYVSSREHYKADAVIVWCFDARFSGLLDKFISDENLRNIDLIKIAGGVKDIASPAEKEDTEYVFGQIAKSVKLHHPAKIILMAHKECGAYGKKFESKDAEKKFYTAELKKAETEVSGRYPGQNIEAYYADFSGLIQV